MKKLLFAAGVLIALVSCNKNEMLPSPQKEATPTGAGISFTANLNDDTKAGYTGEFNMYWYAEEDVISVWQVNAVTRFDNETSTPFAATSFWDSALSSSTTDVKEASNLATARLYKATQSKAQGQFTSKNENNLLSFGTTIPSFRVMWPGSDNKAQVVYDDATPTLVKSINAKVPFGNAVQYQTNAEGSSTVRYNVLLPEDPKALDPYDEDENPIGIKLPNNHESVGQSIPLKLAKQFYTLVAKVTNYDRVSNLYGDLQSVDVESSDYNIAFTEASTIDIYQLNDKGKYTFSPVNSSNPKKVSLILDETESATPNYWQYEDGTNLYITVAPVDRTAKKDKLTVTYNFTNAVVKKVYDDYPTNWVANKYQELPTLDLSAEPYAVLSNAGSSDTYSLLINECFYDKYAGIDDIFAKATITTPHTQNQGDIIDPGTLDTRDKDKFVILHSYTKETFDAEEVKAIKTIGLEATSTYELEEVVFSNEIMTECPIGAPGNVTSLLIPNVSDITKLAFSDYGKLLTIDISSATEIPANAFKNLGSLQNVIGNKYSTIRESAFENCIGLLDAGFDSEGKQIAGINTSHVTLIEKNAFKVSGDAAGWNNLHISAATFPEGAFLGHQFVTMKDDNCTLIAQDAISSQTGLKEIYFKSYGFEDEVIRTNLFIKAQLEVVDLTAVDAIGIQYGAGITTFEDFTVLKTIYIGNNVSINSQAFRGCSQLENVWGWDASQTNNINKEAMAWAGVIGQEAFANCVALKHAYVFGNESYVSANAFNGCTGLLSVELGDNITKIAAGAFMGCTNLGINSDSPTAPYTAINTENVITIDPSAFENCSNLIDLNVSSVTSLGASAFKGCSALKGRWMDLYHCDVLYFDGPLTSIPASAFEGCTSVGYFKFKNVTTLGQDAFKDIKTTGKVQIMFVNKISTYAAGVNPWTSTGGYAHVELFVDPNQGATPDEVQIDQLNKRFGAITFKAVDFTQDKDR